MSEPLGDPIPRPAARVVLLDPEGRVLLFRFEDGTGFSWWATPGGGLEEGETHEQAALRELHEETGLAGVELGPCVWIREHAFPMSGRTYRQQERFYAARVDPFEVDTAGNLAYELEMMREHRWFSVAELRELGGQRLAPRRLASLLQELLAGYPEQPLDVGV